MLDKVFQNFGITYSIEDTTNLKTLEQQFTDEVKAILIETPANPLLTITDIEGVARIAKRHGALTIVDNTFMSPICSGQSRWEPILLFTVPQSIWGDTAMWWQALWW